MGLFTKENCCLCGGKTGLFDKKCLSGKVCKDCTKKLSVWFDDFKGADKALLEAQIDIRERHREMAKNYNFSKIFGEFGVILIDEENKRFIAFPDTSSGLFGSSRNVTSLDDVIDLGPDIIKFSEVEDFEIDITETTREEKRTVDGKQVSYDPPHILYMETFTLRMKTDHPYIGSVYIQLNNGAVQIKNIGRRIWTDPGRKLAAHLLGLPGLVKENMAAVYDNKTLLDAFMHTKYEMPDYSYGFKCTPQNWEDIRKYHYYLTMAREIQETITGQRGGDIMVRTKLFFAAAFALTSLMFMSTQAFAYMGSGTEADHFIVKTEDDLNSCVQKGEYIDLGADIVLNGGVDISTKRIHLDLCGHSCTLAQTSDTGSVSMFTVSNNKQFFIDDSSGQNGTLSTTGDGYIVLKCDNGYLYIDGGNFLSESGVTLNVGAYASVNINDGFFKTEKNYPTAYVTSNARGTLNINGGTFENGEKYGGLYFDNPMVNFYSRINGGIFNRMYIRDNNYMDLIIYKCTVYNQLHCIKKIWGYIADDSSVYVDKTKQDRNVNSNVFEGDKIEVFSGPAGIKAVFEGGEYLSPPTQYFSDYYPIVTEPQMPYGFNGKYVSGWYTDSKFKNKFDFDTPLENDITLYAKWVSIDNEFDMTADGNTVTRKVFYGDWVMLWADEVLDYKKGISWTVSYPLSNGRIRSYKTTSNAYAFLEMDPFEEPFDIILKEGNKVEIYAQGYSADDPDTAVTTDTVILDVIYKRGDIDGNGKIEQNDAALYLKHLSDIPEYVFSEKQNERADANFNGDNDMLDVIAILKTAKK